MRFTADQRFHLTNLHPMGTRIPQATQGINLAAATARLSVRVYVDQFGPIFGADGQALSPVPPRPACTNWWRDGLPSQRARR